jgi:hypothetical protein
LTWPNELAVSSSDKKQLHAVSLDMFIVFMFAKGLVVDAVKAYCSAFFYREIAALE